jgi:F-type H+-transporting ATPase subunit epsilon
MNVEIITPEQSVFSGEVKSVVLPGSTGSFGILKNHAPIIATLKSGDVRVTDEKGTVQSFAIKGGTVEVSNNRVTVLAE